MIFISYRRRDNPAFAGRLFDRLTSIFGRSEVFMDISSIDPGSDFVRIIEDRVSAADLMLVIIGCRWVDLMDDVETSDRDHPIDFVRLEIELALQSAVALIPILVDGATMPRAEVLPITLRPLTNRQCAQLSHCSFDADTQHLVEVISKELVAANHSRGAPEDYYLQSLAAKASWEAEIVKVTGEISFLENKLKKVNSGSTHTPKDTQRLVVAYHRRGRAFCNSGDYRRGIADYDQALKYDCSNVDLWRSRAWAFRDTEQHECAINDLNKVIEHARPTDCVYEFLWRGFAYLRTGCYGLAVGDFEQVLRIDPDHWTAKLYLAMTHRERGEFDRAISEMTALLDDDPKCATLYLQRALAYERCGQPEQAIADYQTALGIPDEFYDPSNAQFSRKCRAGLLRLGIDPGPRGRL